ncbi:MAG: histidinol-phosphatase [Lentisphaeria bacterium]|nr:histidinol-phosphatase [Lentisphaeria bacterium]NQZ68479.1 histidinol-phosphatase [Lentisphaeria bacterium]
MSDPIMYDMHMHTPLCKHAQDLPVDYAAHALSQGLKGITFTCHNPMPNRFSHHVRMEMEQWDEYLRIVREAQDEYKGRLDVQIGLECDYYPGYEDFVQGQTKWIDFDYILGSIHPHLGEYRKDFWQEEPIDNVKKYFDLLAESAELGCFDCLAHPDLIKNMLVKFWDLDAFMPIIKESLDRIAETGVAMELNTSGIYKSLSEMNPSIDMLAEMNKRNIPVVIGSDSHISTRVADLFPDALNALETAGYENISYFKQHERHDIKITDARNSLTK